MRIPRLKSAAVVFAATLAAAALVLSTQTQTAMAQRGGRGAGAGPTGIYKNRVTPTWFDNNTKFWYRNDLRAGAKEFILVDAAAATRGPAFDHKKLAAALSEVSGAPVTGDQLPFAAIEFVDNNKSIRFSIPGAAETPATWKCNLETYAVTRDTGPAVTEASDIPRDLRNPMPDRPMLADATPAIDRVNDLHEAYLRNAMATASPEAQESQAATSQAATQPVATQPANGAGFGGRGGAGRGGRGGGGGRGLGAAGPAQSPDQKFTAVIQNNNVVVRAADGTETPLSTDGTAAFPYARLFWSPDSSSVVAFRMEVGDHFSVYRIQSSPTGPVGTFGGGVGRVVTQAGQYALPGDKFDTYELNVFNVASKKQSKPLAEERFDMDPSGQDPNPNIRWQPDGFHFRFDKYDRGHQRYRLGEVDAHTGVERNIIDEKTDTFIWTANRDGLTLAAAGGAAAGGARSFQYVNYLQNSTDIIYCSEMDGWRHLYLIDSTTGKVKNKITNGDWPIRFVDYIDEANKVIWFMADGIYPGQDPLYMHYGHVNFDGTGLVWMTEGNGMHNANYSPDYKYLVDSYSRVDMPPVTELRRTSDGKLVVALEKAEVDPGANPLEPFAAKGRDGTTDIYGTIARPRNFDPTKKYPIIENIYAGPQGSASGSFVPKTYALNPGGGDASLLNLGFIVVHIDGMGTPGRSKAFHDVCWHNLADGGFPDRVAWIKAAAAKYTYMDVNRVGIFGTSAGGQNTGSALLFHGDFYKVGVTNSGCHDNRMDKATWNEQWMGYPVGAWYSASSNIDNAYRLQGHLQVVVGELDTNVPPESSFRLVDALIKARRDFEFVVVPGADHGAASPVTEPKRNDFFVRYLMGVEPANRNETPGTPPVPSTGAPAGGGRAGAGAGRGAGGGGGGRGGAAAGRGGAGGAAAGGRGNAN